MAVAKSEIRQREAVLSYRDNCLTHAGCDYVDYTSNDYLNLSQHPALIKAFVDAAHEFGVGSRGSPHLSGYSSYHQTFEKNFARWQGRETALLFNSGYHANVGLYAALADRNTVIFSDKLCHASILDGILLSRAKHVRYHHQDLEHLQYLIKKFAPQKSLIVTESVFSMEGDISPVPTLCEIAKKAGALLCIDDAHGVGVLGKTGKGVCEYFSLTPEDVDCLIQPLGKAFGSFGAMVSGKASLMHDIEQLAKSYRYSTHIPASLPACGLAALPLIHAGNQLNTLAENILFFNTVAKEKNIQLINDALTPIRCVITHSNENTMAVQAKLKSRGHLVSGIRTPTVPKNKARLRISLTSLHTKAQIQQFLTDLSECHE